MEMLLSVYLSVYLPLIVLHVSEGCNLVNHGHELKIKANVSSAVLLPCFCTDINTTAQSFQWRKINKPKNIWGSINEKRVQLVNASSPGNLSLFISNLTVEDEGLYRCEIRSGNYTDIHLTIKGSTQIIHAYELTITAHAGGSILLPCHSANLTTKPKRFKWRKYSMSKTVWDDMSSDRHRFQLVNDHSPGNLSLIISHLTKEDEGVYRCELGRDKYTDMKLVVEVSSEPLPFVPFAVVTVIFLHIIVAAVYCSTRKKDSSRVYYSTADGEESVTLE
ncbi:V-set and immunoglobulin domain-containing protein 1-like [Pangasianodon hypophthalmus]|uniref:V-set and immunoglobulin domain-containing protein 1-like n=1 Tax=Pangasianodon hypophthalmus TaxID=310915 RepID=UPI002307DEA2|nr:V-set and immunoglobulin domain-containing protein 1-like [Pangasianodon hypophthalmus]